MCALLQSAKLNLICALGLVSHIPQLESLAFVKPSFVWYEYPTVCQKSLKGPLCPLRIEALSQTSGTAL